MNSTGSQLSGIRQANVFAGQRVLFAVTILMVIWATFFCTGCAGVCIVDIASSSVIVRIDGESFREEPLYIKHDGFVTLRRTETNTFVIKDIDFDGKERGRTYLPLFRQGYGGDDYAFSDDGKLFAYISRIGTTDVHQLHVCSVIKPRDNILPKGVCDNLQAFRGYTVFWIDSSTVLLYAKNAGMHNKEVPKVEIEILHISDMKVSRLSGYFANYSGAIALSPAKRYLLASEGDENPPKCHFRIIDLRTEEEIFMIEPTGKNMEAWGVVWSSDDEIVYAVDGVVYEQRIGAADKREVFRMPPKRGIWLYAVDCKRNLHYQMFNRASDGYSEIKGGWRIHNLDTNEDRELTHKRINGRVLMNSTRDKIVTPVE